jgi:hypothetical protein
LGSYNPLAQRAADVCVLRNYAYVAFSAQGISILNVSDPSNPFPVNFFDVEMGFNVDMKISGNYIYLVGEIQGLQILDITDPVNPQLVGSCDLPGTGVGVFVSGNYAYVGCGGAGFRMIDISNPVNPFEVRYYNTPGYSNSLYVVGRDVYAADGFAGLQIYRNLEVDVKDGFSFENSGLRLVPMGPKALFFTEENTVILRIYDISGRRILHHSFQNNYLFEAPHGGVYLWQAQSPFGNPIGRGKFIIVK